MIRASATLLALLTLFVSGCGEKDEPEVSGPPVTTTVDDGASGEGGRATGEGGVALEKIGDFESPVYVTQPKGDSGLYVVEQAGQVVRVGPGGKPETILDVSSKITAGGEQGLLSVAFPPDFGRTGLFYVDYTNEEGDTRVVEYKLGKNGEADPRSARTLLRVGQPFANHNGGLLIFDEEGNLLVGLGDGGAGGDPQRNGQDLSTLLGKILRIDPSAGRGRDAYGIPESNPFAQKEGARPEILAYGLRNPWRFSLDRKGGGLWIGDVGQDALEEIDFVPAPNSGANFGWSAFEGTQPFNDDEEAPNAIDPVLEYGRDEGCSVTGGYVVRDRKLKSLYGRYLYADFCQGELRSFTAADAVPGPVTDDRPLGLQVPSISSFGEDQRGRIYAVSLDGPVFRLEPQR